MRLGLWLSLGMLSATPALAADAPFCAALRALGQEARTSGEAQRVAVLKQEAMVFACGRTNDVAAQRAFCDAALGAVGVEFTHAFPWKVYDCLKRDQLRPKVEQVDQYTGLRGRRKIVHLSAGWKDGTRLDIRFHPDGDFGDAPEFKDYWGFYRLVIWRP